MDEGFDTELDMSSDMDVESDLYSDTVISEGEDLSDIPDDISEDTSDVFSDTLDLDPAMDDVPDSIDEDITGDDSVDISDTMEADFGADIDSDFNSEDADLSPIPEDVESEAPLSDVESEDASDDVLDDLAEDVDSFDEDMPSNTDDLDSIPEDVSDAEAEIDPEDESAGDFVIPEDVDTGPGADSQSDAVPDSPAELTPMQELSSYMNDHNYGPDDFSEYSQDPEWQRLHEAAFPDWSGRPDISEQASADAAETISGDTGPGAEAADFSDDGVYRAVPGRHGDLTPEELNADGHHFDLSDSETETADLENDESRDMTGDRISGQDLFRQFGAEQQRNGSDYFVRGDHYAQYEHDYYAPDDFSYAEYEVPQQRDISPKLIEGIHLGKSEFEDPSIFWSQHEKGGTAEGFQEIASHIPEVRERLAAGDTLDDLSQDDRLSDCANIYFRNMPEVIERDGYYEFTTNGRHRILAARALGHDIPVKVVGKRSYRPTTES